MTENQEMAGCFVLEELDLPKYKDVTYANMVQCVVLAHDKAATEEPFLAAKRAIAEVRAVDSHLDRTLTAGGFPPA